MTSKNERVKAGILSTLIAFAVLVLTVGGLGTIPTQEQVFVAPPTLGVNGISGGIGTMGGDGGIATSGNMCTTSNCNATGVSENGAPGTAGVAGTGVHGTGYGRR
jgi:hypothetical protein